MRTFTIDITKEQLALKQTELENQHIVLQPTFGCIEKDGCKISYQYDGSRELTIIILKHPFIITEGAVEHKIEGWFKESTNAG